MMILKTNRLNFLFLSLAFSVSAPAEGFNTFDCLRDMITVTERGSFQYRRKNVEKPFLVNEKFMVFPEVIKGHVTGFFVYDRKGAWYFDTIEILQNGKLTATPIRAMGETKGKVLYQMVAQPGGLETVTIYYMPGLDPKEGNTNGPVVLGASVLPVVGAFVSRPEKYNYVYQNPATMADDEVKAWIFENGGGRRPASADKVKINRQIATLKSVAVKSDAELWSPMKHELELRTRWTREHNLDEKTFKELSRTLDTTCRR